MRRAWRQRSTALCAALALAVVSISDTPTLAESAQPTAPAGCRIRAAAPEHPWFAEVRAVGATIEVRLVDPLPATGDMYLQLCAPGDDGGWTVRWMFRFTPRPGATLAVLREGAGHAGPALQPETDYWVRVERYDYQADSSSGWYYVRTGPAARPGDGGGEDR